MNSLYKKHKQQEMDGTSGKETQPLVTKSTSVCSIIFAVGILVALQSSNILATISVQVSGIQSNIFQINNLRFIVQSLAITPVLFHGCDSIKLPKAEIYLILVAGSLNVIFFSSFYFASSFMPMDNLNGLGVASYILFSTSYDFFKKSITKKSVVISGIVIVETLLVVQPWIAQVEHNINPLSPCHVPDSRSSKLNSGVPFQISSNNISGVESSGNNENNKLWFGYIFIIIAFIALTLEGNIDRLLINEHPLPVVMFWLTLWEGLLSFVINLIWTRVKHQSLFTIPSGRYCLTFLCCFVVFSSGAQTLSILVYKYWHISSIALSDVLLTVTLYVSQRTFLSEFHPGHANVIEIIGIAVITFGVTLFPLIFFLVDKHKE